MAARKFEVQRALALYEQHEATRRREGLAVLHPTQEPLLSELRTGKFTVLVSGTRKEKPIIKRVHLLVVISAGPN